MKGSSSTEKRGSEAAASSGNSGSSSNSSSNAGGKVNQMKLVGNYLIYSERLLGQGQYGKVFEAAEQNNTTKRYAVKVIPSQIFKQSTTNSQMLQKEIDVLKKLRHDNLVCLREISQSPNNLYLFLDFCNGGDLAQYIDSKPQKKLSESEAIELFKQFVAGYQHLYESKIIHRDVKPENLMLHNGQVKLGDFGFGRFVEGNMNQQARMSIKCTPIYASPQLLKKEVYSSKCDVWSSGCLLYKMLYGEYPFMAKDMMQLIKDIETKVKGGKEFEFTAPVAKQTVVSEDVKGLLRSMLKYEEADRISWEEVFHHSVLTKSYNVLGGNNHDDGMTESDKSNPIFQSIIQNRNHVLDNDLVSDTAQNFQVRGQKLPVPSTHTTTAITTATTTNGNSAENTPIAAYTPLSGGVSPSSNLPTYQPYNFAKAAQNNEEQKIDSYSFQQKQMTPTNNNAYSYGSYQTNNYATTSNPIPEIAKLNLGAPSNNSIPERNYADVSPISSVGTKQGSSNSTTPVTTPMTTSKPTQQLGDFTSETTQKSASTTVDHQQVHGIDSYRNNIQLLQNLDQEQMRVGQVDKMVLFLRNQALFADVTMQLVFTARNKYQLSSLVFYELIYSLTGFYSLKLDLLRRQLNSPPQDIVKTMNVTEEDFVLYSKSKQFKKTELKISKDSETANTFFKTLSAGILKEITILMTSTTIANAELEQLKDFEQFIKNGTPNSHEYRNRFSNVAKKALLQLQPEKFENDVNSLRGIRGIQIFIKLDEFMPVHLYLTFDFRYFYDQYMNKVEASQLVKDIKSLIL